MASQIRLKRQLLREHKISLDRSRSREIGINAFKLPLAEQRDKLWITLFAEGFMNSFS
jgi:hypothetical protein